MVVADASGGGAAAGADGAKPLGGDGAKPLGAAGRRFRFSDSNSSNRRRRYVSWSSCCRDDAISLATAFCSSLSSPAILVTCSVRRAGPRRPRGGLSLGDAPASGQGERHQRRTEHCAEAHASHGTPSVVTDTESSGHWARARSWSVTVVSRLSGTSTSQSQPSGTLSDG